jgi:hypothetical protein
MTQKVNLEAPKGLHTLILGASGVTGWAITNAALSYLTTDSFERIIGFTSRSLCIEEALLPNDPRLQLRAGLDLSKDTGHIINYLQKIDRIEETTHIYFACKIPRPSSVELADITAFQLIFTADGEKMKPRSAQRRT